MGMILSFFFSWTDWKERMKGKKHPNFIQRLLEVSAANEIICGNGHRSIREEAFKAIPVEAKGRDRDGRREGGG
jgi:hypothetical protein